MSTIEEAREQAREALGNIWDDGNAAGLDGWVGPGRGAGEVDDEAIRSRDRAIEKCGRALLDATDPPDTTTPAAKSQLEAVTSAIEKVLDGQEALHCTRVLEAWGYGTMSEEDFSPVADDAEAVHEIASAVLEALEPRPITDEMVAAAAREYHERGNGEGSYARASEHVRTSLLFRMECALRAAEEARR